MKAIFKTIVLFSLMAILLSIWVPHYIAGPSTSSDGNSTGATIGGVAVGQQKGEELKNMLAAAVNDWYTENLTLYGGESVIEVDASTFQFDIESTVEEYEAHYKKPWYAFWASDTAVHLPVHILPNDALREEISKISLWDTQATYEKVQQQASYLIKEAVEAVVIDLSLYENERISLSIEPVLQGQMGIEELVYALNNTLIGPGQTFSMLEQLGETVHLANREAVNFIASNLYNAALYANGEILERHSQQAIPVYLKPGLEARVDVTANEDLKFTNTLSQPMLVKLSVDGGNLLTEVYTSVRETDVVVTVSQEEEIQPRTITRFSDRLEIGETELLQEGVRGLRVSVYRNVNGEEQLINRDYYAPVNRILLKTSRQPEVQLPAGEGTNNDLDLDGDGFPDAHFTNGNGQNSSLPDPGDEEQLPPGSYYDKGGNLITP